MEEYREINLSKALELLGNGYPIIVLVDLPKTEIKGLYHKMQIVNQKLHFYVDTLPVEVSEEFNLLYPTHRYFRVNI